MQRLQPSCWHTPPHLVGNDSCMVCVGGGCTGECVQNYNSCSVARNVVMSFVTAVNLCPGIPDRCDTLGRSDSQCLSHDLFSIR